MNVGYANAQISYWGVPKVPKLVIQSGNDETLGDDHFQLLNEHFQNFSEIHVLDDMPHTAKEDTEERRKILEKWLKSYQ